MHKPFLIVVTGRSGSGKTTLAHALAQAVHCPALGRDAFKDGFVQAMNSTHDALGDDVKRGIYETFFQTVKLLVAKGISLVVAAAFQHKLGAPKLEPLQALTRMSIVLCTVDPLQARARCIKRDLADPARERFHGDRPVRAANAGSKLPICTYNPPSLAGPTLYLDTTDGYCPGIEAIDAFVMRCASDNPTHMHRP